MAGAPAAILDHVMGYIPRMVEGIWVIDKFRELPYHPGLQTFRFL